MNVRSGATSFVIGRDLGPAGRVVRILAASLNLAAAASAAGLMGTLTPLGLVVMALTFVIASIAYTLLVAALGPRLLSRIDPWLAAIVVVLPLAVVFAFPGVPAPITVGLFGYIGVSQLVQAAIGYGGCEVVGIPTLVLRRRYTVFCALNAADAMEDWFATQARPVRWALALVAFGVATSLGLVAEAIDSATGFFVAYLAFLVIGYGVSVALESRGQGRHVASLPARGGSHEVG